MRHLGLILGCVLAASCGSSDNGNGNGNGNGDGSGNGSGDGMSMSGDGGGGGGDANCGGMAFGVQRVPPNVMLVLDRSGSMGQPIAQGSQTTKWQDLSGALQTVITQFDSQIRFGADLFANPGGNNCTPGGIAVPCGPSHGAMILAAVAATQPGSSTPTATTLDVVIKNGMLNDTTRDNYVVLATDGLPNCGDTDVLSRINTLYNSTPSVKTFVIGVGDGTASNPALLNSWAVAGHTDQMGTTKYYQANSPADLQKAFTAIAGGVVTCTLQLQSVPPDPNQLYVWLNNQMVPIDASNGYTYSSTGPTVTLHGTACDTLKNDPNSKVDVIYGCPSPPIT